MASLLPFPFVPQRIIKTTTVTTSDDREYLKTDTMAQLNIQAMSDACTTLATELALVPNVPAVNIGAQLLQIQNQMQQCF